VPNEKQRILSPQDSVCLAQCLCAFQWVLVFSYGELHVQLAGNTLQTILCYHTLVRQCLRKRNLPWLARGRVVSMAVRCDSERAVFPSNLLINVIQTYLYTPSNCSDGRRLGRYLFRYMYCDICTCSVITCTPVSSAVQLKLGLEHKVLYLPNLGSQPQFSSYPVLLLPH
jgi:hypothetical protein